MSMRLVAVLLSYRKVLGHAFLTPSNFKQLAVQINAPFMVKACVCNVKKRQHYGKHGFSSKQSNWL